MKSERLRCVKSGGATAETLEGWRGHEVKMRPVIAHGVADAEPGGSMLRGGRLWLALTGAAQPHSSAVHGDRWHGMAPLNAHARGNVRASRMRSSSRTAMGHLRSRRLSLLPMQRLRAEPPGSTLPRRGARTPGSAWNQQRDASAPRPCPPSPPFTAASPRARSALTSCPRRGTSAPRPPARCRARAW
jgi:hypothetical protein